MFSRGALAVSSIRFFFSIFATWLIAGCASVPPVLPGAPLSRPDPAHFTAFEFSGRLAVKQGDKGNYGNIRWVKRGTNTNVTLLSPLGQVVAKIQGEPGAVVLTLADNRQYRAEDGETLTREVLGYTLPVRGLNYWLLGLAAPGTPTDQGLRPDGLLDYLKQDGWHIQYTEYMAVDGVQLPRRLVLDRAGLEFRLAIDRWTIGEA